MQIDIEHAQPCDIGADCPAGQSCDIPSHKCLPNGVAIVSLPADDASKTSWSNTIFAKVTELILAWKETRIAYDTMRATRQDWHINFLGNGWSQQQDDQFWLIDQVVATLGKYAGEIDDGVRDVAFDTFGNQPVIGGDLGDMVLRVTGDTLHVKFGSAQGDVSKGGFVGAGPVAAGVVIIVVAGALMEIAFIISIAWTIHDYIVRLTQKDVLDAREREAQERIKKGEDPASAYNGATANTQKTLEAEAAKAKADAEGAKKGMEVFETVAWVALGVAVLGVAAYFASPFINRALASTPSRPQLAQANPARAAGVSSVTVVRLDAGNDANGNPRRLFLIMNPGGIVAAVDEGYSGSSALVRAFGKDTGDKLVRKYDLGGTINTTPGEYRSLLKDFPSDKANFSKGSSGGDAIVLHLNAGNDANGNPRRMFLVFTGGTSVDAIDEGYSGTRALPENLRHRIVAELSVPANERRQLLKYFSEKSNPARRGKLRSEVNTSAMYREVESLARDYAPDADQIFPAFEHGHWWVSVSPDPEDPSDENSEATYSVEDTSSGLSLERV